MHLSYLDRLLWAAGFFAHAVLLAVLFVRNRAREFPLFTSLIGFNEVRTVALFLIQWHGTRPEYFYTYWSLAPVDVGLQILVIVEMAANVFRPRGRWALDVRPGMAWWAIGSVVVGAGLTAIPRTATSIWEQVVLIKGSFFSAALLSEMFAGMIVLSARSGLPWKTHVGRILQGIGTYSLVTVMIETARTYFGLRNDSALYNDLSRIRRIVYLLCAIYWIVMLWREAPAPRVTTDRMREDVVALARIAEYGAREVE